MANRLSASANPYLRQHADNPVDWWEWGPEPFEEAARRDVPVILSVGYSSCHWCHVMAHESFEDESTAEIMNRDFVNIKVDREERPDVDAVYMEAVQALTGRGGWPMTVWLTPDAKPFYAGTYFPATDRPGMPSFTRVLGAITDSWKNDRQALLDQAGRLTDAIDRDIPAGDGAPDVDLLRSAYDKIIESTDPINGGFGTAPKFPQAPVLEFLLRISGRPWAGRAAPVVRQALVKMARGGIYDHVIGGFARYSVDPEWLVPHFEKMLYDNAQLARVYLRAGQVLADSSLWTIARETLDYLNEHLRHPDGGYFSAQDADSEGEEGKFAVFTHSEVEEIVGDDAEIAAMVFGVTRDGNFDGANVLHRAVSITEAAEALGIERDDAEAAVERAIQRLRRERARRVPPGLDDKVVTSWNGLAIRAFAEAGAVLEDDGYLDDARSCATFLLDSLVGADGRLLRSWADGRASVPGFLEDHASLAIGLLSLYQATGEARWYSEAERLVGELRRLFADAAGGAMFTTGDDAERLIARKKDQMDNPLPSGNSLAAEALIQLGHYSGDLDMIDDAHGILAAGRLLAEGYPSAVGHLLAVAASTRDGIKELAVTGPGARALASVAWEEFRPDLVIAVDPEGDEPLPLLEDRHRPGETLAYVCEHFTCAAPVSSAEELRAALSR